MVASAAPSVSSGIASPWPGPRLLVPISVYMMLQTNSTASGQVATAPSAVDYNQMKFFGDPGPQLFVTGGLEAPLPVGATIGWALPSALTRSTSGGSAFPPIPNRWLVVRRAIQGGQAGYSAWVIESDYTTALSGDGTNVYPTSLLAPDSINLLAFGRALPVGQWPAEDSPTAPSQPNLTAASFANASFAAFQPGMANVLSYTDGLSDIPGPATLTYWVAGWYAQPELDPLYCFAGGSNGTGWSTAAEWLALTQSLNWSVGTSEGTSNDLAAAVAAAASWVQQLGLTVPGSGDQQRYPAQILCHGMTFNAQWPGLDSGQLTFGVPVDPVVTIGVGRTSSEAFSAMVAAQLDPPSGGADPGEEIAQLIQAFQYHLLDSLDSGGAAVLSQAIHDAAFGATDGGTIWKLMPAAGSGHAALPALLVTALADLNVAQSLYDDAQRRLAGAQQELYTAWFRLQHQDATQAYLTQQQAAVSVLSTDASVLAASRDGLLQLLEAMLVENPGPTLHSTPAPPFWTPLDPVVAISGVGRGYVFGEDTNVGVSPDGTLFCRFSGQTLTGVEVAVSSNLNEPVTGASLATAFPSNAQLPYDIADLVAECLLLDTAVAAEIAAAALSAAGSSATYTQSQIESTVETQQTIQWNGAATALDEQSIAKAAGLVGTVPCVIAVTLWTNAWIPLYLDWEVAWSQYDPSQWSFDGEDFTLEPSVPTPTITFSGRTLLTPNVGNNFYETIQAYAQANPDDPNAQTLWDAIEGLPDADLLSQRLSGLGSFLQTLEINKPSFAPTSIPSALIGNAGGIRPYNDATSSTAFYPVAAGQMVITKLWVVDAFGQALPVIDPQPMPTDLTVRFAAPIRATAQTEKTSAVGRLPPRVIQPTRLELDLIDATDDVSIVALDPAANPICGWLLPNHLDQSLAVYDQDGQAVGEMMLVGVSSDQTLQWRPTPGSPQGLGQPPAIANAHLAALVNAYLDAAQPAATLANLLQVIDETLSSFSPPIAAGTVTSMAAAIGNPVAVVNARATLRLAGNPALSQLTQDTGNDVIGNAADLVVPFQLGSTVLPDDGLLGYYVDGNFSTLLTLASSGGSGGDAAAQFTLPLLTSDKGPPSAALLLLMDPRGAVHAATGLLPVVRVTLPAQMVAAALAAMSVTFQAGPVLTDSPNIRIPVPALGKGSWSWLDRPTPATLSPATPLIAADALPRLPAAPLTAVEGWLQLSGALGGLAPGAPATRPRAASRSDEATHDSSGNAATTPDSP
jgi:hypothetical protein